MAAPTAAQKLDTLKEAQVNILTDFRSLGKNALKIALEGDVKEKLRGHDYLKKAHAWTSAYRTRNKRPQVVAAVSKPVFSEEWQGAIAQAAKLEKDVLFQALRFKAKDRPQQQTLFGLQMFDCSCDHSDVSVCPYGLPTAYLGLQGKMLVAGLP
eukprot:8030518-Alexandrium_andersonii.AAC.1